MWNGLIALNIASGRYADAREDATLFAPAHRAWGGARDHKGPAATRNDGGYQDVDSLSEIYGGITGNRGLRRVRDRWRLPTAQRY